MDDIYTTARCMERKAADSGVIPCRDRLGYMAGRWCRNCLVDEIVWLEEVVGDAGAGAVLRSRSEEKRRIRDGK